MEAFLRLVLGVIVTLTSIGVDFMTPAAAAGSKAIIIEGPGLDGPREIDFGSPPSNLSVNQFELAAQMGAWFNARAEDVVPLLSEAPTDDLGPRWTVTWVAGGPAPASREERSTRQEVYLDAVGGPLVHTPDGQGTWEGAVGWYQAPNALRDTLRSLGVPLDDGDGWSPWTVRLYGAGALSLAGFVLWRATASRKRRRRPGDAVSSRVDPGT